MGRLDKLDLAWRTWHRPVLRGFRWAAYIAVTLLILGAAFLIVAHAWLPTFASRKDRIANFISQRSSYRVQIDRSEAYWHGLNPGLRVYGLTVYPPGSPQVALRLKELQITLAWLPLLAGRVQINNLVLIHPDLSFERLADGTFRITGLAGAGKSIPGPGAGFLPWLFQQNDVAVQDGQVEWIDYKATEPPLRLSHVNLSLQNSGNRHRLQMNAVFPGTMCQACSFLADVTGNPLADRNWEGEIDVQAEGLNTYALPQVIRDKLPAGFDGRFNVVLSSLWSDGVPLSLYGYAGVAALKLALPGVPAFEVRTAAARVNWTSTSRGGSWTLQLDHLQLGLVSSPWFAGQLRIEHNPYANHFFVQHVNVNDVDAFLARLKNSGKPLALLRAIRPGGTVNNLRLRLNNKNGIVSGYAVEADMHGLSFDPYEEFPGVQGLTGHLSFDSEGGEMVLASKVAKVTLPLVFRSAIGVQAASGQIKWRREDHSWRINAKNLNVVANDGTLLGALTLRLPDDDASPYLDLQIDLANANLADAARYYPNILSATLRNWLGQSVVSGTVSSGQVIIQGALRDFPFRDGNGRFQVLAHIKNGVFRYLEGWPRIVNIDADLLASGPSLSVAGGSGNIRGLSVRRVAVTIDDLAEAGGPVIRAVGQVTGPVDQAISVLYASHIHPRPQLLFPGMHASGQGVLSLDLAIPAHDPSKLQLTGTYQLQDAALFSPLPGVSFSSINGSLQFNQDGPSAGSLYGKLLGGKASLAVATVHRAATGASIVDMRASGTMTQAGLQQALGSRLGSRLSGNLQWNASLRLAGPGARFGLAMDLKGLGVKLPPPLDKPVGVAARLTLQTRAAAAGHQVLDLQVGDRINGRFVLDEPAGGDWKVTRATVAIGGKPARLVPAPGLRVSIDTPRLDADRWWQVIRTLGGDGLGADFATMVTAIDVKVDRLHLLERSFGALQFTSKRGVQGWTGTLSGDDVAGRVDVRSVPAASVPQLVPVPPAPADQSFLGPPPATLISAPLQATSHAVGMRDNVVNLVLQRLTIPEKPPEAEVSQATEADPRSMPELHLRVQNFRDWGKALGQLDVDAVPAAQGWHIQSVQVSQQNLNLSASGDWLVLQTGGQSTSINMQIHSTDLGRVLNRLGYGGKLVKGRFEATGQWQWTGGPTSFRARHLNGSCELSIKNGRLPKISPGGAGRLLGLIDTRALTRYLTLDFSNVFGKGFTFDSIGGKVTVQNGNAYTKGLTVKGPSATINVGGRLGLSARDMDLDITVVPRLGDQLTVTSMLLGGPVVGAAVAVFRNILKRPLEQTTETQYVVTGSWDDPRVTKGSPLAPLDLLPAPQ
ncbi:MAG: YhdP family protein [Acidiferrobacterales bacterium]